jgi:23S rRNA pseudouridine1911/1915/1917 synthase
MITPIFEDKHIIIAEKPARIGVGTDDSNDKTFLSMIRDYYIAERAKNQKEGKGYCVPIHFLDRPVSGVMVFATSSKAAERINKQFRKRTVSKNYIAIVEGVPDKKEGTLKQYLSKNTKINKTWISSENDPKAKFCELSYEVISSNDRYSKILVKPKTGRSHQIRVQLSDMGYPIVGDIKYGASFEWHKRIALHSTSLEFVHPVEKQKVIYTKNPPSIFEELL